MRVFVGKEFRSVYDQNSRRTFADLEFQRCRFVSSNISMTTHPTRRSTVRNMRIIDCEELGCSISTAMVEEVVIDGLKTSDVLCAWGAVF